MSATGCECVDKYGANPPFLYADCPCERKQLALRIVALTSENERLRAELDEAQLRSIEARNPGIDMDEVRAVRAARNRESAS